MAALATAVHGFTGTQETSEHGIAPCTDDNGGGATLGAFDGVALGFGLFLLAADFFAYSFGTSFGFGSTLIIQDLLSRVSLNIFFVNETANFANVG